MNTAMAIGVSVNGILIFIWMAEQAEAERIRETIPRIAKEAGTTPVELFKAALNGALDPSGIGLRGLVPGERAQQMQKWAFLWMVLENETHLPEYPGKVIDHIAHTNFTVDIATLIDGPAMIKITALPPEAKKSNLRAHLRAVILGVLTAVVLFALALVLHQWRSLL
jgi:hypothetical protein